MNLLLITADQWRGDCLSCLGHAAARTPNLDRLAADGVLFARHYAQATPCGPSRASLHTGLYALNHRSITNGTPLDARHKTLAGLARAAGHDPVLFGYTDTSADPRALPADSPWLRTYEGIAPGFRVELRLPEAEEPYLAHLRARGYVCCRYEDVYGGGFAQAAPFAAEDSITAFLTDRFLHWLQEEAGSPWFAHLSFLKPHPPFVAAEPWFSLIPEEDVPPPSRAVDPEAEGTLHPWLAAHLALPLSSSSTLGQKELDRQAALAEPTLARLRRVYLGLIAEVDHHIGRILDAVTRRGELDRTLVLFTADHGEMLADHWMLGKAGFFPQAFHVPLIVRPPTGARGRRVDAFTEHVDLMPTVLQALGLEVPLQCDGASLGPFLSGHNPRASWRVAAHWEHDFRDVVARTYETALNLVSDECALAVRFDGRYAYVHFAALPALCFDAVADPSWCRDLTRDPRAAPVVLAQAQAMLSWRMRAAERRLTGCALTASGVVGRFDPA